MKLLLDTHAFVWFVLGDNQLSAKARTCIENVNNEVFVSVASIWELAITAGLGKWPEAKSLLGEVEDRLSQVGFAQLPILVRHVRDAGLIDAPHRDPFDRILAAQALIEDLTVITADAQLASLGAPALW